jgi:triosephosphate isomerase
VLVAGNWKMHKRPSETAGFCRELWSRISALEGVDVAVCPPYTSLAEAVRALAPTPVAVYAQNVHWAEEGPYTGEVSAEMLRDLGVDGAIIGHSERRRHFGETDEGVARRAAHALEAGLVVVVCVGELEEERERGETEVVLRRQVSLLEPHPRLLLAYEPVWAIGGASLEVEPFARICEAAARSGWSGGGP